MKKKIIGLFVCILLIFTVLPATGAQNADEEKEASCGLAETSASSEMAEIQVQNDIPTFDFSDLGMVSGDMFVIEHDVIIPFTTNIGDRFIHHHNVSFFVRFLRIDWFCLILLKI